MPASRVHLIRHGEVFNPKGVLYGRLDGFPLSELGEQMASDAALALHGSGSPVTRLVASPLLRTQQSAKPVAEAFDLVAELDDRLIEPFNIFEGRKMTPGHVVVRPHLFFHLRNPYRPSWGEPYEQVLARMTAAIDELADETPSGELVLVTHQLPIWTTHLGLAGLPLAHNPNRRRCALSSITTIEKRGSKWVEVDYRDPAAPRRAKDKGAV
jgi:broad specificity phosphatase PhoE